MNAAKYMEVLHTHLLPQLHQWHPADDGIYQQDNAPCHKARVVTETLQDAGVRVMAWPPYSPDLSPIENLWAIVKRKLHEVSYSTVDEMAARVVDIWRNDTSVKEACMKLIESMPRRIHACIQAKGGVLKY
jgi:hypothetical protein